jgi:hypothetical protein
VPAALLFFSTCKAALVANASYWAAMFSTRVFIKILFIRFYVGKDIKRFYITKNFSSKKVDNAMIYRPIDINTQHILSHKTQSFLIKIPSKYPNMGIDYYGINFYLCRTL